MQNDYDAHGGAYAIPAAEAPADARAAFITRTYGHLLGAIIACAALIALFIQTGFANRVWGMLGGNWLIFMVAFMVVSWAAERMAFSLRSPALQYGGLGLYVAFQAIFLAPILQYVNAAFPNVLVQALLATGAIVVALTYVAFTSKKDFSFVRGLVSMGVICMLVLIACSFFFGLQLGLWFSFLGVIVFGGMVLYQTQDVLHRYPTNMHVGASLALFASIATLFFYVLRVIMALSSND